MFVFSLFLQMLNIYAPALAMPIGFNDLRARKI